MKGQMMKGTEWNLMRDEKRYINNDTTLTLTMKYGQNMKQRSRMGGWIDDSVIAGHSIAQCTTPICNEDDLFQCAASGTQVQTGFPSDKMSKVPGGNCSST